MTKRLAALVVESEVSSRNRLKEAAGSVYEFETIATVDSIPEMVKLIEKDNYYDVVFLSHRLGDEEVSDSIKRMKTTIAGRDAAYVLLLENDISATTIATNMIEGADGFLLEPYSVEALREITLLAEKVKRERQENRIDGALGFLVDELMGQVDQLANLKKSGHQARISQRAFEEIASVLKDFDGEMLEKYYELAVDSFIEAPLPAERKPGDRRYSGASQRVRKRIASRAIDKIQKAIGA